MTTVIRPLRDASVASSCVLFKSNGPPTGLDFSRNCFLPGSISAEIRVAAAVVVQSFRDARTSNSCKRSRLAPLSFASRTIAQL